MSHSRKNARRRLHEIAESQQGFFTTKQALQAGFSARSHFYHVQAGDWIREYRGIYRLAQFPLADHPDLMQWYLWSRNNQGTPEGVYSHETALSLFDLSDVMPARLHMTVPKRFRRSSPIPRALILHRANLFADDIQSIHDVNVTKPLPTIINLLADGKVSKDILIQAVGEGMRRGLITQATITRLSIPKEIQREWQELLKQVNRQ